MKTNILTSNSRVINKYLNSTCLRLESLSIVSRQSVFGIVLVCLTVFCGNAWALTETITLSDLGWSDATAQTSITATSATIALAQNSAGTAPTYYTADGLRIYGVKNGATTGGTISFTPKTNITISSIVFTHTISNGGFLNIKTGTGSYNSTTKTWSGTLAAGNTVSLVVTNPSDNKNNPQVKITKIVITYTSSAPVTTYTMSYNANSGSGTMTDANSPYASGATVKTLPNSFTRSGYIFTKWNTAPGGGGTNYAEGATFSIGANTTLYAQWVASSVRDDLSRATTEIADKGGYGSWSGKSASNSGHSTAVYAGYSAGGNNAIQLRSSGSVEGIVTTTSGGTAKYVYVVWQGSTAAGRTIDIYGKNDAYSSAADLFSATAATQGTKLGSIVCGTSTVLTISGSYKYIGIRSKSDALYLSSVSIEWTPPVYTVTYDANGGSVTPSSHTQASAGASITLATPTLTGYNCSGWYTATTGGTKRGNAGASYTPTADETVHAQWSAKTYSLTLDREGATTGATSVTATYNSSSLTGWSAPAKDGYEFLGYYSGDDGTGTLVIDKNGALQKSVTISTVDWTNSSSQWVKDGTVTLHAKWCELLADLDADVKTSTSTSVTLQWTKISGVDATTPYEVEVSPNNDDETVGSIDLTGSKATCEVTGLNPCTEYTFTIWAYKGSDSYCDDTFDEVVHTTSGTYTYTVTKTNVSLKGGETEATDNCDDFLAEYVANSGYALPTSITVTGASAYEWEDGVLSIEKANVTGNVTVSITGIPLLYYRGSLNSWGSTAMTLSSGGTYFYYKVTDESDDHQFKISTCNEATDKWTCGTVYNYAYNAPGFCMTDIMDLSDESSDACKCTYDDGDYYIIVFRPSNALNSSTDPKICVSTTLPNDSPSGLTATKILYFTPNDVWSASGAKFAVNYDGHGAQGWSSYMTQSACDDDIWQVEIPKLYSDIIIVRLDPSESIGWGAKLNNTGDLRIPGDKNRFTLSSGVTDDATTTWSAYTPDTYTISFSGGTGSSGSMSDIDGIVCSANQALTANTLTKTGYSFSHWTADKDVKVGGATIDEGDPIDDEATIQNITSDIALTAQWTANKYDVTLKPNSGSGSDQTVQATYGSSMPLTVKTAGTAIVVPTRTGYDFNGYWDDASSGTQYYTYTGSPKALGSACNWDKAAATNLFAHWTAKQTTVSFNQNSGSGGQTTSKTATYDAAMPTPITLPTREGHTFAGYYESTGGTGTQYYAANGSSANNWDKEDATWTLYAKWNVNSYTLTWSWGGGSTSSTTHTAAGSVNYGTTLVYPDDATMSKTGYSFTGWSSTPSTMPATATTITAQWNINSYNVAVLANSNVTITANSTIDEGEDDDVNYATTVTLSYTGITSGLTWGGWRVYKADDASTTVTVTSNQFTMPAYDVKVEAIVYSVGIAWCDPDVEVTGDVHLTSTKDVYVHSTSGAGNLISISSSDMGSATKMEVAYLNADAADAEVDKDESVFRFYNAAGTDAIDAIDLDYEWGTSHSIKYTPNAYDQRDNYKLQLTFKRGDKVLKTVTHAIYGRALPEEFVIASKYLGHWYALPNTMGTSTETVTPILITVDNATTPTEASYAPSTTVYKGADRKRPGSNVNSIRLTNDGSHWLITNNSNAQLGLSATETEGYENREVWYLKSSNFGAYELAMDPAQSPSKKLGMYSGNMGMYADPAYTSEDIYLLPITNKYTPVDATATDWTGDAIGVTASTSATKMGIAQEDGTETDPVTLSSSGTSHAADFDGDIDFTDLTGETLWLTWYDGSDNLIGGSQVTVPSIVLAGANDEWSDFASAPTLSDIVVLSKPMTIDEVAKAKQIVIDQSGSNNGKLVINADQSLIVDGKIRKFAEGAFGGTSASDLTILSDEDGTGALITGEASDNTQAAVQFYSKARYESGYVNQFIGVPLSSMTAYNGFYGTSLRVYDDANDKWQVLGNNAAMYPFTAYNLMRKETSAGTLYMEGALNLPGTEGKKELTITRRTSEVGSSRSDHLFANSWTAPIDIASMDEDDFDGADATIYIFNAGTTTDYGTYGGNYTTKKTTNPGQWLYMPVEAVKETPSDFSLTVIPSMQAFMVHCAADNLSEAGGTTHTLTLDYKKHVYDPAKTSGASIVPNRAPRREASEDKPEIVRVRVEGTSGYADDLLLFIGDDFSNGYDNGWEAYKVSGKAYTPQLYAITEDGKKAISAQPDADNTVIGFKAGTEDDVYTFTLDYEGNDASLYLHDTYTDDYVRVEKDATYTFLTTDNTDHPRFVLTRFNAPQVTTGVDDVQWNGSKARKLMIEGILYIIRGGRIYNAEGAMVK